MPPATPAAFAQAERPAAREHQLAVAELAAVGVIPQRVAAAHDARVDAAHHERRQPAAEAVVAERLHGVPLGAEIGLRLAVRAEGVGIGQHAAARRVLLHRVDRRSRRVDRASARAAPHGLDHEGRLPELPMTARLRRLVQEQRADVGRDRVEAAGVDDPGAAGPRLGVGGVDRPAHEQHLAGEVGVVRPRGRTGLDERLAVLEVRADRGRHDARRLRQRRDRIAILAVGDYERPIDAELGARLLELGLGAAAERDPDIGRRVPGEVPGRQYSYEAGRPVDDDVVVADGLSHVSNLPSREVSRIGVHPMQSGTSAVPSPCVVVRSKTWPDSSLATTHGLSNEHAYRPGRRGVWQQWPDQAERCRVGGLRQRCSA